jgi:hypothetical protein
VRRDGLKQLTKKDEGESGAGVCEKLWRRVGSLYAAAMGM